MGHAHFDFKQFRIEQGACGMKVTTDACIQGAWTPVTSGADSMLDIGTGTGLLALMLAQRAAHLKIDALEMDEAAAGQARANVVASPFDIQVIQVDVRTWQSGKRYDLIVCNPPFFINSLQAPDAQRNAARHDSSLKQEDLLSALDRLLANEGRASILLPVLEMNRFTELAATHGWFIQSQLRVKDRTTAPVKRVVALFGRVSSESTTETLIIKGDDGDYTAAFRALLAPYYLHL